MSATVCRGCAGTGLRYDMPGVALQVAQTAIQVGAWADPVSGRHREREIPGVGSDSRRRVGTGTTQRLADAPRRWCALDVLETYDHLLSMGAQPARPLNFTAADLCSWCAGLGVPGRLTVHALETAIKEQRCPNP